MIVKKILVFSCTIQGFKKLVPVVKQLLIRNDILLQVVVCSIQEVEYCKAEGIAYHRVDEYSSLTRMADWDTDLAIDALQYLLDQETPDLLLTIDSGGFMEEYPSTGASACTFGASAAGSSGRSGLLFILGKLFCQTAALVVAGADG